jgi:hypothetical protein
MVFELYDPPGDVLQISERMRNRFKKVVQNADLSSPLQRNILKNAKKAFQINVPRKFSAQVRKLSSPIKKDKVLSIDAEDIGKFS